MTAQPKTNSRGFRSFDPIPAKNGYPGQVLLYESSLATEPCVWIAAPDGPVHLTLDQAALLRDQLTWLIDNHYQVNSLEVPSS